MLLAARVVHPFPSLLNALLVLALALIAGGTLGVAVVLALSMLGIQLCIGAANDWLDREHDRAVKPAKPIAAGVVSPATALAIAGLMGGGGMLLAASRGIATLLIAAAGLAAGLVYDAWLKRGPWAWLAFALALPLIPLFAWSGAVGALAPRAEVLLPLAAIAGPQLQLANGLVDLERDRSSGLRTLPAVLGRRLTLIAIVTLSVVVYVLAWLLALGSVADRQWSLWTVAAGTAMAAIGLGLSASASLARREWGWRLQAVALALVAVGWLASAA